MDIMWKSHICILFVIRRLSGIAINNVVTTLFMILIYIINPSCTLYPFIVLDYEYTYIFSVNTHLLFIRSGIKRAIYILIQISLFICIFRLVCGGEIDPGNIMKTPKESNISVFDIQITSNPIYFIQRRKLTEEGRWHTLDHLEKKREKNQWINKPGIREKVSNEDTDAEVLFA